jgi:hypothetical protein
MRPGPLEHPREDLGGAVARSERGVGDPGDERRLADAFLRNFVVTYDLAASRLLVA